MNKPVFVSLVAAIVIIADQLTKIWIRAEVKGQAHIPVIPGWFDIVYACNPGGAFSFLAGAHEGWRLPFFFVAAAFAIGMLLVFLRQVGPEQRLLQFSLAGILGGAIGNLIDRVVYRCVTDFLDVYWGEHHWPAFNVADSFISVGVVVLFLHSMFAAEPDDSSARS